MSGGRAQLTYDPLPAGLGIALVVVVLVGKEMWNAYRDGLEQCVPGCDLGAPLFAHVGNVEAAVVAGVLLVAAAVPLAIRLRVEGGDE